MKINETMKQWIHDNLQYDPETGSLIFRQYGNTAIRRKINAIGVVCFYVTTAHGPVDAASACWLLKAGVWPEHGVTIRDHSLFLGVMKWSNLKMRSERQAKKETTVLVQRDLLERVMGQMLERMAETTVIDEQELNLMQEIRTVLEGGM
jgi:hypothetical protein